MPGRTLQTFPRERFGGVRADGPEVNDSHVALADPTRRAICQHLAHGRPIVGQLVSLFPMSPAGRVAASSSAQREVFDIRRTRLSGGGGRRRRWHRQRLAAVPIIRIHDLESCLAAVVKQGGTVVVPPFQSEA